MMRVMTQYRDPAHLICRQLSLAIVAKLVYTPARVDRFSILEICCYHREELFGNHEIQPQITIKGERVGEQRMKDKGDGRWRNAKRKKQEKSCCAHDAPVNQNSPRIFCFSMTLEGYFLCLLAADEGP